MKKRNISQTPTSRAKGAPTSNNYAKISPIIFSQSENIMRPNNRDIARNAPYQNHSSLHQTRQGSVKNQIQRHQDRYSTTVERNRPLV